MAAEKIRVQLKWIHQAQFAGFYVAMDKGYYANEDLDVVLIPNNGKADLVSAITGGVADVAVLSPTDIIIRRSQGIPIKAIAAIYRRSAVVYLSMPGSGIRRPQDFVGKTIASEPIPRRPIMQPKNIILNAIQSSLLFRHPGYHGPNG